MKWMKLFFTGSLLLYLVACTTTTSQKAVSTSGSSVTIAKNANITLMPIDIELSLITISGLPEIRADWTKTAKSLMTKATIKNLQEKGFSVAEFDDIVFSATSKIGQVQRLTNAVTGTILTHQAANKLPSKKGQLSWGIGENAKLLNANENSNYALSIYFRDTFSSTGRAIFQAAAVLAAAFSGVESNIQGGQQLGFATLVDTKTGEILWYQLMQSGAGDTRKEKGAQSAIKKVLSRMPFSRLHSAQ